MLVAAAPALGGDWVSVVTVTGVVGSGNQQIVQIRDVSEGAGLPVLTIPFSGSDGLAVRNELVDALGRAFAPGRTVKRVTLGGVPGFKVEWDSAFQVFVLVGADFTLLEPGGSVEHDGITYAACEPDVCSPAVAGGMVPTVGEWGLVVMVMLMLIAASVIFARRRVVA